MQTTSVRHNRESAFGYSRLSTTLSTAGVSRASGNIQNVKTESNPSEGSNELIEALINSKVYRDYERAFMDATGMQLTLRPADEASAPLYNQNNEGPFCHLLNQNTRTGGNCLQADSQLSRVARFEPAGLTGSTGSPDTAVPVRLGDRLIGYLRTGPGFQNKPAGEQFERTTKIGEVWAFDAGRETPEDANFATPMVSPRQHEAVVKLLTIFADHLSMLSNQLVLQQKKAEPIVIRRAKEFIAEHQTEDLSLGQVARAVNTSTFYFCKLFKKFTGLNFTDYVSRIRIERSKNLLLNPNMRISEIAYEVGFQSLTHFNRVFKKVLGLNPTEYRVQVGV